MIILRLKRLHRISLVLRLMSCVAVLVVASLWAARSEAEDWGYSHNLFVKKKLSDRWSFESRSLFTSRENMHEIFLAVTDAGLSYDVTKWLNLGASYRAGWILVGSDYEYESRPLINLTLKKKVKGAFVSNRSRVEFRYYDFDREDDVRFRNETRVVFPWKLTRWQLKPYLEEEFFYADNAGRINMNWVTAGFTYQVNENVRFKSGYRWNALKFGPQWEHRHVWVTGFAFIY